VLDELLGLNDPANTVDTHDREAAGGWNHLRGLGIIDDNVLDGHLKTIRTRRTRAEQSAAIGAAKELLEATLKGVLLHYNPEADISGDLPKLWKEVRSKLVTDSDSDPSLGSKDKGIAQLSGSLAGVIDGLAYIRNRVGSGHGRSRPPRGLSESHVLLSVDSVYTLTRFIAQRYKERAMSQK
jgi:Abortive infection C-terminus